MKGLGLYLFRQLQFVIEQEITNISSESLVVRFPRSDQIDTQIWYKSYMKRSFSTCKYRTCRHSTMTLPSIHNFSTSVSIFAVMIPTENPIRMKKPIPRTAQENRCEKHPSLKNIACSFARSFNWMLPPHILKDFGGQREGLLR